MYGRWCAAGLYLAAACSWAQIEGLAARGTAPERADKLKLFGQFVGNWEFAWTGFHGDGTRETTRGEWHFGWVLEGRAVQDVFIVPSRAERARRNSSDFEYGTTIRFYDPNLDAWRVVWIGPVNRNVRTLLARAQGNRIVIEGANQDGRPLRWTFSEITPSSFRWTNEILDLGASAWRLQEDIRAQRTPAVQATAPLEKFPGIDIGYQTIASPVGRLQAVISKPQNASGRLPGVLLVGWLSCDPVEFPMDTKDGFGLLLHGVARDSGMVMLRVNKTGIGASQGPACADADFAVDLAVHRAALAALRQRPDVDPRRIFLLGLSNGGGVAPLVAEATPVAGYVVSGGWSKTWFEHMIELERRRLTLSGENPGGIAEKMRGYADFYSLYLNRRLTPAAVLAERPDLRTLWTDEPERQYGRPAAFFHQLQQLDLAAAWAKVDAPVLAVHGEYDWIMSREDHVWIADAVNRRNPGRASFRSIPRMDHFYYVYADTRRAFQGQNGRYSRDAEKHIIEWLRARAFPN
jgi:pimeloyl-ACP methyl ester carboxylesterase